jgi:hypothetical protein
MWDAFLERNRVQSDAQIIDSLPSVVPEFGELLGLAPYTAMAYVPRAVGRIIVWADDAAEIATVNSRADAMMVPAGSPC